MKKYKKVLALITALTVVLSAAVTTVYAADEITSDVVWLPPIKPDKGTETMEEPEKPAEQLPEDPAEPGEQLPEETAEPAGQIPEEPEEPAEPLPEDTEEKQSEGPSETELPASEASEPAPAEEPAGTEADTTEELTEESEEEQPAGIPMREGPDGLSVILEEMPADAEFTVISTDGDWVLIQVGDSTGYVYGPDIGIFPEQSEDAQTVKKVTIFANRTLSVAPGDPIRLTSRLEGFEGAEYILYQWECNKGSGWMEIPGATDDSYSFIFNDETNHTAWRLRVISD